MQPKDNLDQRIAEQVRPEALKKGTDWAAIAAILAIPAAILLILLIVWLKG
jgi:hypothetical protein